jgi:hypothetical protein
MGSTVETVMMGELLLVLTKVLLRGSQLLCERGVPLHVELAFALIGFGIDELRFGLRQLSLGLV